MTPVCTAKKHSLCRAKHFDELPLSEQPISTHVATRSPSSASTQVFLQPIAMPRWSISAKDVKDNALLAELLALRRVFRIQLPLA